MNDLSIIFMEIFPHSSKQNIKPTLNDLYCPTVSNNFQNNFQIPSIPCWNHRIPAAVIPPLTLGVTFDPRYNLRLLEIAWKRGCVRDKFVSMGSQKGVVPGRGADYHAYAPKISSPEWLKPNIQTRLPVEESRRPSISIFNPRWLALYSLSTTPLTFVRPLTFHDSLSTPRTPRSTAHPSFPSFFPAPWFCFLFSLFFFFFCLMLEGRRVADIHRGNSWLNIFTVTGWNLLSLRNSVLHFILLVIARHWQRSAIEPRISKISERVSDNCLMD